MIVSILFVTDRQVYAPPLGITFAKKYYNIVYRQCDIYIRCDMYLYKKLLAIRIASLTIFKIVAEKIMPVITISFRKFYTHLSSHCCLQIARNQIDRTK